jgi:hypothetical protein
MAFRSFRRLAIAATALFVSEAASRVLSARADDPVPTTHEAAVLDGIFTKWKARHDRVRSFHFKWDCRTTCKKGTADYSSTSQPPAILDRDQVFEQSGAEIWVDGDDRMSLVGPPRYKSQLAGSIDKGRIAERSVVVGNTTARYWAGPNWVGQASTRTSGPSGALFQPRADRSIPISGFGPLLLAFRPQAPDVSWLRERCRLVEDDARGDDGRDVKCRRVVTSKRFADGGSRAGFTETISVSPVRDDLVVRWVTERSPVATCFGTIRHKKDKTYGWIPSEWSCDFRGEQLDEYRVTSYEINEKIDPSVFSLEFPPGTPICDQLSGNDPEKILYFVVEKDGSKRTISGREYARLRGVQ